jgi:hypothetical protein
MLSLSQAKFLLLCLGGFIVLMFLVIASLCPS